MTREELLSYCLAKAGASRDEANEWLKRYPEDASVMAYVGRSCQLRD